MVLVGVHQLQIFATGKDDGVVLVVGLAISEEGIARKLPHVT
jgi:hypothetical protein